MTRHLTGVLGDVTRDVDFQAGTRAGSGDFSHVGVLDRVQCK